MDRIADYTIIEKTAETRFTTNYRCRRDGSGETFILKMYKITNPTQSEIARFKQEFERIKNARVDGVIKIYDIIDIKNELGIVLEDIGGITLGEIMEHKKIPMGEFLKIAAVLSGIIGDLHKNHIIHSNIKPRSVFTDENFGGIKIADFTPDSLLASLDNDMYNPFVIRQFLPYMSPEQTSRINWQPDYRTDMYSLGITFYEMLTGVVPFISADPLEIIHSHIARMPVPPGDIDPAIPEIVSEIILKLLSKNLEDRYQNCYGLMSDLNECRDQYKNSGTISSFLIGTKDIPVKYNQPKELIGRTNEVNLLVETLGRVRGGSREMTIVTGPAGIGKTMLAGEMNKLVAVDDGYFIAGKYDQLSRDVPYSGIITAFKELIRQVLLESRESIDVWKEKILQALSPNGRVITSIIPDLELIIGEQPPVPELGTEGTRNRFNLYFEKFINVFANADHPVALFLDDLQWADQPSLALINTLLVSPDIKYFFIIGAYRESPELDNDVLLGAIKKIENEGVRVNWIKLAPFSEKDVRRLTVLLLKCSVEESNALAKIILKKTGGNPFFINQFLQTVYNDKLPLLLHEQGWQWDIEEINNMDVTENVVGLLSEKIKSLPRQITHTLKVCACIGGPFELETAALVMERPIDDVLADITTAADLGLLGITGDLYKFQHDRIRETAYSMISDEEKPALHYKIGRIIYNSSRDEITLRNNLFLITEQMNFGRRIVIEKKEEKDLAELCLKAGEKAMASNAHGPAYVYFKSGIDILRDFSWDDNYNLLLKLHECAAEAGSLAGDFIRMDELISAVILNAKSIYDKISVYETKIKSYIAQNKPGEATRTCLDTLSGLGLNISRKPTIFTVLKYLLTLWFNLIGKKIENLPDLPEMPDRRLKDVLRIIFVSVSATYVSDPLIWVIIILEAVTLSVRYGVSSFTALAYMNFAGILCGTGFINTGVRFGEMALRLLERPDSAPIKTKILLGVNNFIFIWRNPISKQIDALKEAFNIGLETGDFEFAAICALGVSMFIWSAKDNLNNVLQNLTFNGNLVAKLNQKTYLNFNNIIFQYVTNLVKIGADNCRLSGESYDEDVMLKQHIENNDKTALCLYYMSKTYLCFMFDRLADAHKFTGENRRYMASMISSIPYVYSTFMDSLVRIACLENLSLFEKVKNIIILKSNQRKMKKWAGHAPMNFLHMHLLLRAELARIKGRTGKAQKIYDLAIEAAKKNGYINLEAMGNELAAGFYFKTGKAKIGGMYLIEAYRCYTEWGALAKTVYMEEKYPEYRNDFLRYKNETVPGDRDITSKRRTDIFDLSTILKACQAISGEIDLGRLLEKMLNIIMENAGAEKGILLLEENGELFVRAQGDIGNDSVLTGEPEALEDCACLSVPIVTYVQRTGETIILNNASIDSRFINDPYIVSKKPKSLLCKPIIYQGKLTGIIYLENNLAAEAFTEQRDWLLRILSAQAAISIDNARLIALERDKAELEKENREVKFKLLQDRMSPHFLFNSLNSILSLMRSDVKTAERAIFTLSDNYRFLMDEASKSLIPFERAWKFANNYLQIEKLRFSDMLTIEVVKKGDFSDIKIPPLIIQPLLENALKHGELFNNGKGYLKLSALRDNNEIIIEVMDNGAGLKGSDIYSRTLGNISNRLKLFNGNSELVVKNCEEGGVRATIMMGLQQIARPAPGGPKSG